MKDWSVLRMDGNPIDEIIGQIFKIESTALGIQSDAENEKKDYAQMMEQKTKEFDEQLDKETSQKLEKLTGQLKKEKEEEMSAMRNDILKQTSKMEEMYELNHERWVKDIVENIIKE